MAKLLAAGGLQVAGGGLREPLCFAETNLHGAVAVAFGGDELGDVAGTDGQSGDATEAAPVVEDLCCSQFCSEQSFDSHGVTA